MNCPICNKPIKETDTYCANCGSAFTSKQLAFTTVKSNPITKPISALNFLLLMIVGIIPIVSLVTYLILAFKPMTNLNLKAYSRAALVFSVIYNLVFPVALWLLLY